MAEDLANSKWLSEIKHENYAWINPKTARALRLIQDSKVKVKSAVGEITMKVRITSGIHPQVIAISKGQGHWEFGKIAQAEKFKSSDPDTELLWWNKMGNGENPNFIVEIAADPIGKGQAWNDTKVIVEKV
jgi:anaerobic selenocysteine-containing dehydrogenase